MASSCQPRTRSGLARASPIAAAGTRPRMDEQACPLEASSVGLGEAGRVGVRLACGLGRLVGLGAGGQASAISLEA